MMCVSMSVPYFTPLIGMKFNISMKMYNSHMYKSVSGVWVTTFILGKIYFKSENCLPSIVMANFGLPVACILGVS